jgi:hypothetical protein
VDRPAARAIPPPALPGTPNLWTLEELVDVDGPLEDPDSAWLGADEHAAALDDLRAIESVAPPPPHSDLPPGAESVGAVCSPLFASTAPPGPMTVSLTPPSEDDYEVDATIARWEHDLQAPRRSGLVAIGTAALLVAAGVFLWTRGPAHMPSAAAPATAGFEARGAELARDGDPVAVAPPDTAAVEAATPRDEAVPTTPAAVTTAATATRAAPAARVPPPPPDTAEPAPVGPAPTADFAAGVMTPPPAPAFDPSEVAAAMNLAAPPPAEPAGPAFDREAASRALADAELRAAHCASAFEERTGAIGGEVAVTFAPSGRVTSANVSGSHFAGRLEGSCVARELRAATVPPFVGDPVTVRRRIVLR